MIKDEEPRELDPAQWPTERAHRQPGETTRAFRALCSRAGVRLTEEQEATVKAFWYARGARGGPPASRLRAGWGR